MRGIRARNTHARSRRSIAAHYDLGNEFFELMLDETMMYSSGYFLRRGMTLAEASTAKLELLTRGLAIFGLYTVVDFNRLRRAGTDEAIPLAAAIFLDVLNIFLLFLRLFARSN